MSTTRAKTLHFEPTTAEELLDREEALAIQRITDSARRLGDDLCAAVDLRGRVRRHPFLAMGLSALSGLVGGPLLLRGVQRVVGATAGVRNPIAGQPRALAGVALILLRVLRSRR